MSERNISVTSAAARRKKSVAEEPVTSVLPPDASFDPDYEFDQDGEVLAALGYKPEFKREFSLFTTFCVSFAVLGLLPSFASTLYYGMGYAGTGGMTWGWIVAMVGVQCVAMSMAELCSSMPTSGGLYYAAAVLAPPGYGPFAAWITGWSNWLVQITGAPSVNYGTSAMLLAAASISHPSYIPQDWHVFLLTVLLMLIHGVMSSMPTGWLAKTNSFGSTFNFIALIIVLILIPAGTDRESRGLSKFTPSSEVWGTIGNTTDWPDGIAVLLSFVAVLWTMSGYDAPFHLAEECSNANVAAPRAIVMTSTLGGIFGWFLQLVVAYTVVDIPGAIDSDLGQPFAAYLMQCLPQKIVMAVLSLTIIAGFFMGQGCMIAASRVTFAYARDGCFPLSRYWSHVNTRTRTPVNAVWFNVVIGILMLLLIFGGSVSIGALFSVGAIAAEVAFITPVFIRVFFVGNRFRPGPWNLGRFSIPIGCVGIAFVCLMIPILNFPSVKGADLTYVPPDMNWTILVYGGPMFIITVWWFVSARKWFKGPKVNVDHLMLGAEGNLIDGKGGDGASSEGVGVGKLADEAKMV
ncbi:amino acid transporter [Trichodelitschia bisporula]|uniref:Amino acid transporter n=1 Tax=Trichodelitschia bisporula TaxID=703511 RepID=A0A6G1HXG6_9PEZI|nr:amino acid transporter [Trichodelitschia bisporula]